MTSSDNFRFDHYRGGEGDHWQLNVTGGEVRHVRGWSGRYVKKDWLKFAFNPIRKSKIEL